MWAVQRWAVTTQTALGPSQLDSLLRDQWRVVARGQLLDLGFSDEYIEHQLRTHRWQRLHRGVYATFSGPLSFMVRLWAALLRAGPGAVASHQTAAYLDGLVDHPPEIIHLTLGVDHRLKGPVRGVRVHYAHRLPESQHPVKLPPRTRFEETVLDVVDTARDVEEVATWVTCACQRRLSTPGRLAEALANRKKIRWRRELEAMVADVEEGALSPLELRYLRRVERAHRLPRGVRNRRWEGRRVIWIDVDVTEYRTRVELDGRVGHEDEGRFRDRRRDNRGTVDGNATLRYGHSEVFGDACGVAGEVAAVLQPRGWQGAPRRCGPRCSITP